LGTASVGYIPLIEGDPLDMKKCASPFHLKRKGLALSKSRVIMGMITLEHSAEGIDHPEKLEY